MSKVRIIRDTNGFRIRIEVSTPMTDLSEDDLTTISAVIKEVSKKQPKWHAIFDDPSYVPSDDVVGELEKLYNDIISGTIPTEPLRDDDSFAQ